MTKLELEEAIAGIYIAIISALDPERREAANDMLVALADDSRTCAYAAQLFRDLAESATMAAAPIGGLFESLTLH
jgi:hypothetical protein